VRSSKAGAAFLAEPSTFIWKGKRRKTPDTPLMEVKKEMTKAIAKGIN